MTPLPAAFLLGVVAGARTFTAPAAVWLERGGTAGYVLAALALGEYAADLLPSVPARTSPPALAARIVSGSAVGYAVGGTGGVVAALAGVALGAFGGYRLRIAAIARLGPIAAGLGESAAAALVAALCVTRLEG